MSILSIIFFLFYHLIKNVVVSYIEQCYFAIYFVLDLNILFVFFFLIADFSSSNVFCCVGTTIPFRFFFSSSLVDNHCSLLHILIERFVLSYRERKIFYADYVLFALFNSLFVERYELFFFDKIN